MTEIQYLKGVGPKRGNVLKINDINNIKGLLKYYPRKYLDRTNIKKISSIKIGENTVIGGHSFVNKDCKKNSIYFGVPAKKIRKRKEDDTYL